MYIRTCFFEGHANKSKNTQGVEGALQQPNGLQLTTKLLVETEHTYYKDLDNAMAIRYLFNQKIIAKCTSYEIFTVVLKVRVIFLCCQIYSFCFTYQDSFSCSNFSTELYSVLCHLLCYYIDKRFFNTKMESTKQIERKSLLFIIHKHTTNIDYYL